MCLYQYLIILSSISKFDIFLILVSLISVLLFIGLLGGFEFSLFLSGNILSKLGVIIICLVFSFPRINGGMTLKQNLN